MAPWYGVRWVSRMNNKYLNGILFVLLAALWGVAFMAIRAGIELFPPVLFAAIRYDLAAIILVAYAWFVSDRWLPRSKSDILVVVIDGTLLIGLYNIFIFLGEQTVSGGVAAILVSMNPILSTVFSRLILPSRGLKPVGVVGLASGFVGVVLISGFGITRVVSGDTTGQLLVLAGAASFAFGSVVVQLIDESISTEGTTGWACVVGAVLIHVVSFGFGESTSAIIWNSRAIGALLYLVVGSSVVGYFVYFYLLDELGPVQINLVSYAAPVFAAVSGWLVLGEQITPRTILGFLLIFAGFLIIKRKEVRNEIRFWVTRDEVGE